MKSLLIAKNNIKRSIGTSIVLFLLIAMASIMLYTGVSVEQSLGNFLIEKNKQINGADFVLITSGKMQQQAESILKQRNEVQEMESHKALDYGNPKIKNLSRDGKEQVLETLMFNADEQYGISKLSYVQELKEKPADVVYVPYSLHTGFKYEVGDKIEFTAAGISNEFTIAGFYENVIFGNQSNCSIYEFYLSDGAYQKMKEQKTYNMTRVQSNVRLKEGSNDKDFEKEVNNAMKAAAGQEAGELQALSFSTMLEGSKMFINIMMVMLIAFSLILLIIALVVIRFAIIVHVEKNMKNIGSLEAIGYTTKQIKYSILTEFGLIGVAGVVVGLVVAIVCSGVVGKIVSSSIGLDWIANVSLLAIIITIVVILALLTIVTSLAARRIGKITPLIALRNGIKTHNFKRNPLPLEATRLPVNMAIGCKGLIRSMKQNIVIAIIVILLSFASVFSIGMFYNFVVDNQAIINLVGIEVAEIQMTVPTEKRDQVFDEVRKMDGVKEVINLDGFDVTVANGGDSFSVHAQVADDFSAFHVDTLVDGRLAVHDNEVVVSKRAIERLGLKIGESIKVTAFGKTEEYLIVGTKQHINSLGYGISITTEGMRRLKKDYQLNTACIYLKDGVSGKEMIDRINEKYKDMERSVYDMLETIDTVMNSFNGAITSLSIVCGAVTLFIVVMILLLLIKVKIIRERTQLAIAKGLGYTTRELVRQMVYSFLPVIIIGSVLGLVVGVLCSNSFIAVLLSSVGIMKVQFQMPMAWVAFVPIAITVVGALTICIVGGRIRKITVKELFTE